MPRIYLAASWRNQHHEGMLKLLRNAGHEVYDFKNPPFVQSGFSWEQIDVNWKNWTAEEYRTAILTHPIAARGYMADLRGMQWAEVCVILLPSGRSAHLEAGWFCGQGKRCIIMTQDGEEPELMALLATDICIGSTEVLLALQDRDIAR